MPGQMGNPTPHIAGTGAPARVPVETLGSGLFIALGEAVGSVVEMGRSGSAAIARLQPVTATPAPAEHTVEPAEKASTLEKSPSEPTDKAATEPGNSAAGLTETLEKPAVAQPIARAANGIRLVASGTGRVVQGGANILFGMGGCLTGAVVCMGKTIRQAVEEAREESLAAK